MNKMIVFIIESNREFFHTKQSFGSTKFVKWQDMDSDDNDVKLNEINSVFYSYYIFIE